jgi:hypothetical protein
MRRTESLIFLAQVFGPVAIGSQIVRNLGDHRICFPENVGYLPRRKSFHRLGAIAIACRFSKCSGAPP